MLRMLIYKCFLIFHIQLMSHCPNVVLVWLRSDIYLCRHAEFQFQNASFAARRARSLTKFWNFVEWSSSMCWISLVALQVWYTSHGEGSEESSTKVEYVYRSTCDDRRMFSSNSIPLRTVETVFKTDNQNISKLKTFCLSCNMCVHRHFLHQRSAPIVSAPEERADRFCTIQWKSQISS